MVSTREIRDTYRLEYVSTGADKVAADAARVASATDGVSSSMEKQTRTLGDVGRALEQFNRKNDAQYRAQKQLARDQQVMNSAFEQGLGGTLAYARGVENLTRKQELFSASLDAGRWKAFGDQGAAAYRRIEEAQDRLAANDDASRKLGMMGPGDATRRLGKDWSITDPSPASLARARAEIDPVWASRERLNASLAEAKKLRETGLVNETDYTRYVTQRHDAHAEEMKRTAANQNGRLAPWQTQNLLYQGTDIVTSLAGGMNPAMVALQQGGQIAPMFMGEGKANLKGMFTQAGEAAGSLVARIGLVGGALGGLTAAVGVGAAAWLSYRSEQRDVERQLDGIGRASGATMGRINAIAQSSAAGAGLSVSEARRFQGDYAATGRIDASLNAGLLGVSRDYALRTGQDAAEANKALASSFADPTKGAQELNRQFGFLDDSAMEMIRRFDAQGDRVRAQSILMQGLANETKGAKDQLGFFSRSWNDFWTTTSNEYGAIGKFLDRQFGGGDIDTRIAAARDRLAAAKGNAYSQTDIDAVRRAGVEGGYAPESTFSAKELQANVDKLLKEKADIDGRILDTQRNQRSLEIGVTVRSLLPEMTQFHDLEDQATKLRKAIEDPMEFKLQGRDLADAETAFGRISEKVRAMREDIEKFGSASVAALNRAADDRAALTGLSGYQRSSVQIGQQFRGRMRDENIPLDAPTPAQVQADFDKRIGSLNLFDRYKLEEALPERMRVARQAEGLRRERDVNLDTLGRESNVEAEKRLQAARDSAALSGLSPYQRQIAELDQRHRQRMEEDKGAPTRTLALNQQAYQTERGAITAEAYNRPLRDANKALDEQVAALKLQQDSFGLSTEAAAKMAAQQQLVNQYARQGITDLSGVNDKIDAYATAAGKAAAADEDWARRRASALGSLDDIRGGSRSAISGVLSDVMKGRDPGRGLLSSVQDMTTRMVDRQITAPLVAGALGPDGKPGGGWFGDLFTSFLGGGKSNVSSMSVVASSVTLTGPIGLGGAALPSLVGGSTGTSGSGVAGAAGVAGTGVTGVGGTAVRALVGTGTSGSTSILDLGGKTVVGNLVGDAASAAQANAIVAGFTGEKAETVNYIRKAWTERGMDPSYGVRVASGESSFNRNAAKVDNIEESYGVFQLNARRGLGVEALAKGINVRDPSTWREQIDFAADKVKSGGWGPWSAATKAGIGRWDGVNRGSDSSVPKLTTQPVEIKPLSESIKQIDDAAARAAQGVGGLKSDLIQLPGPLGLASDGLTKLGTSVGTQGGGLLQALASAVTSAFSSSAAPAAAAVGYIPAYALGHIPCYASGRTSIDAAFDGRPSLSARARVDASGVIRGPGTGRSDSILAVMNERNPIRLSNREAIIRESAVKYYGTDVIRGINERTLDLSGSTNRGAVRGRAATPRGLIEDDRGSLSLRAPATVVDRSIPSRPALMLSAGSEAPGLRRAVQGAVDRPALYRPEEARGVSSGRPRAMFTERVVTHPVAGSPGILTDQRSPLGGRPLVDRIRDVAPGSFSRPSLGATDRSGQDRPTRTAQGYADGFLPRYAVGRVGAAGSERIVTAAPGNPVRPALGGAVRPSRGAPAWPGGIVSSHALGYLPSYAAGRPDASSRGALRYAGTPLTTRASVDASGIIRGPGTGTSDSILAYMDRRGPIRISNEEAIIRADAVQHYGSSVIKAINERRLDRELIVDRASSIRETALPRYAEGRVPDRPRSMPIWTPPQVPQRAAAPSQTTVNVELIDQVGVKMEKREVPDGRGGRKQQVLIKEMVAGTASDPQVRSAFSRSPVVRR